MSLEISPETEARLVARARELGISVEEYLEEQLEAPIGVSGLDILKAAGLEPPLSAEGQPAPLPVWNLGVRGTLRRVEIYGDED